MKQDPSGNTGPAQGWPLFGVTGAGGREEYGRFIGDVKTLDFIGSEELAESAVKAVLGVLVNSVEDEHARKLTEKLPEALAYERLRGSRARTEAPSLDEFITEIGRKLQLDHDQAHRLVDTVFHTTKTSVDEEIIEEIEEDLPNDVAEELERS